jgi:hypothetical protein
VATLSVDSSSYTSTRACSLRLFVLINTTQTDY